MKNQIIKIILISFAVFCFFNIAYATLNIETEVDVPANCTVTDIDGVAHNYPQINSYLAICALEKALEQNVVSDIDFTDFGFGLFINSINNISQNNTYWQLRLNNVSTSVGASDLTLQAGDIVSLVLTAFDPVTFAETSLGDQVTLHIHSLIPPPIPTGSGPLIASSASTSPATAPATIPASAVKITFDTKKAFDFLITQQKSDGSFGEDLYTDWTILALASGNYQDQVIKLVKYLGESKIIGTFLTDYERRAMALMALGLNPYNTNGENYIEKIIAGFDGKQFGDANEDNDDIFALIVLQNAGYTQNEKMISDDINFILSRQKENGSWDESVDMAGAGIEALASFSQDEQIKNALTKAKEFLKQNQKDNGSWNNNASSTAWALEGILALNEKPEDWIKSLPAQAGGNTPFDYFATRQDTDGGVRDDNLKNRIWETAYVVSALSGKTWNQIMQKFEKPETPIIIGTLKEKEPTQKQENKDVLAKNNPIIKINNIKSVKPKTENFANQNTASVINAITPPATTTQTETSKKGWFARFLDKIFSIF